jgi:hypothetical protein
VKVLKHFVVGRVEVFRLLPDIPVVRHCFFFTCARQIKLRNKRDRQIAQLWNDNQARCRNRGTASTCTWRMLSV